MGNLEITSICFEGDEWGEPYDVMDCNMDVSFTLSDNTEWVATFFTYQNIETLRTKNQSTGECLNGMYFCASDMVLIERMDKEKIRNIVEDMLLNGEFKLFCTQILKTD